MPGIPGAFEMYREKLSDWDFYRATIKDKALDMGVSAVTICNWNKKLSAKDWDKVRERANEKHNLAKIAMKADAEFYDRVLTDQKAYEFFQELREGWSRKNINENLNRNADLEGKSDEEILLEVMRKADPALLKKVLEEKKAPALIGTPEDEYVGDKESNG